MELSRNTMESEPVRNGFAEKLISYVSAAEIAALVLTGIGLILQYYQLPNGAECLMLGGSALAMVYFLMAYLPPKQSSSAAEKLEDKQSGFSNLLVNIILPKVSFISCSIAVVGLIFGLLHLTGATQMLTIGATSLIISLLLGGIAVLMNNENIKKLRGPLLRSLPLGLISAYWLYTHTGLS